MAKAFNDLNYEHEIAPFLIRSTNCYVFLELRIDFQPTQEVAIYVLDVEHSKVRFKMPGTYFHGNFQHLSCHQLVLIIRIIKTHCLIHAINSLSFAMAVGKIT